VFELERGIDGSLWLNYRFINPPTVDARGDTPAYTSYNITASELNGLGTELADRFINEDEIKKGQVRLSDLDNGTLFSFQVKEATNPNTGNNVPAAFVPKIYRLNALDEYGQPLETQVIDYKGAFPEIFNKPTQRTKYDASLESFRLLAEEIKSQGPGFVEGSFQKTITMHKDLTIIGFSKDFYGGNTINRNVYLGSLICTKEEVIVPEECTKESTCVCLCTNDKRCGGTCNEPDINDCPGRVCYSYPTYNFVGGALGACMISSLWIPRDAFNGENDYPIPTYLEGKKIKDKDNAFNSLSMVNEEEDKPVDLNIASKILNMEVESQKVGVKSLVITKVS
jgi:hypothetical protein